MIDHRSFFFARAYDTHIIKVSFFQVPTQQFNFHGLPECFKIMKTPYSCRLLKNFIERHPSKDLIFVLTIFFVLLNPANQGEGMFLFLHLQRLSFYTLHKWLLMCVYFQIKMSINKSFAKAKEKLEQAKHNSQIA